MICSPSFKYSSEASTLNKGDIYTNKVIHLTFNDLTKRDLDEGVSFYILDQLIDDQTNNGNAIRYDMLTKKSENKRLRMLRELICKEAQ